MVSVDIWRSPSTRCRRDKVALRTNCIKNVKFKIIKKRPGCQCVGYLYYSENLHWTACFWMDLLRSQWKCTPLLALPWRANIVPINKAYANVSEAQAQFSATQQLFSSSPNHKKVTCCMTKKLYHFKTKYTYLSKNADSTNRKEAKITRKISKLPQFLLLAVCTRTISWCIRSWRKYMKKVN